MYKVGDMLRCKIDNPFVSIQFYKDIEYEVLYISEYLTKVSNNKNNYFFLLMILFLVIFTLRKN